MKTLMKMDHDSLIPATVSIILLVTLISGPLVSGIDLTTTNTSQFPLDERSFDRARIEVIDEPSEPVVLNRGAFGNDAYRLLVPPVKIRVIAIEGTPRIAYKIRIRELGYARFTTYFPSDQAAGDTMELMITEDVIRPSLVTKSQYRAELIITVHDDEGGTVVYHANSTVIVRE